jgi:hypothetical protein
MSDEKKYNLWEIRNGFAKKTTGAKPRKPIPKISVKQLAKNKTAKTNLNGDDTELQKWYQKIMSSEKNQCWETGEWIDKYEDIIVDGEIIGTKFSMGWHGSIAHVLPKGLFYSVSTHPLNYMVLKMYGGTHGQYDSNWQNASKMKVWKHACKIFNILYPLLTQEEKSKLPDIVIQEIDPKIYNK